MWCQPHLVFFKAGQQIGGCHTQLRILVVEEGQVEVHSFPNRLVGQFYPLDLFGHLPLKDRVLLALFIGQVQVLTFVAIAACQPGQERDQIGLRLRLCPGKPRHKERCRIR